MLLAWALHSFIFFKISLLAKLKSTIKSFFNSADISLFDRITDICLLLDWINSFNWRNIFPVITWVKVDSGCSDGTRSCEWIPVKSVNVLFALSLELVELKSFFFLGFFVGELEAIRESVDVDVIKIAGDSMDIVSEDLFGTLGWSCNGKS